MTDKRLLWAGWVLSGIAILFLLLDGGIKLVPLELVLDTMTGLGWSGDPDLARGLGMTMLIATTLYAWPKTSVLGAILLTGYLGGAMATHLRIGSPLFSHILFGFYLGLLVWGGLYLRDPKLRALMPWRR